MKLCETQTQLQVLLVPQDPASSPAGAVGPINAHPGD